MSVITSISLRTPMIDVRATRARSRCTSRAEMRSGDRRELSMQRGARASHSKSAVSEGYSEKIFCREGPQAPESAPDGRSAASSLGGGDGAFSGASSGVGGAWVSTTALASVVLLGGVDASVGVFFRGVDASFS